MNYKKSEKDKKTNDLINLTPKIKAESKGQNAI